MMMTTIAGRDGQLPNMDLIASLNRICRFEWVPLYLPSFWPAGAIANYIDNAQTMLYQAYHQAFSIGDESHAVFHEYAKSFFFFFGFLQPLWFDL